MGLSSKESVPETCTLSNIDTVLRSDKAVKVAGVDIDGVLRGKIIAQSKFLSLAKSAREQKDSLSFGFCSVIFGWDMHDETYTRELRISNKENGYRDVIAKVDLGSYRRIPWGRSTRMPFFLVDFWDPDTGKRLSACPRSVLTSMVDKLDVAGVSSMAGAMHLGMLMAELQCYRTAEYEFYTFRVPKRADDDDTSSAATARFLKENSAHQLPHLTEGMMGYSLTDPQKNQSWYEDVFYDCERFKCPIEGWHTESGPGVFEAALCFDNILEMADRAALFKFATKSISTPYGITPCFMAKPREGLPGNSGHMHISLTSKANGENVFARASPDPSSKYSDLRGVSNLGRHFLAGLLDGLPDMMPILAPTVNSYKRLVENFWAPVTVSWGLEHRAASIRVIAPPTASARATRFEVRVPGADANPHLVLAAILAMGWRGVEKKMEVKIPPLGKGEDVGGKTDKGERLAKSLKEATARFMRRGSVAREVFGDEFVEHFGGTRDHEVRLWEEAVTDWEVRRYIEMV